METGEVPVVVYYVDYEFPGVTTTFTWREVALARERGYDVRVLSTRSPQMNRLSPEAQVLAAVVHCIGKPPWWRCLRSAASLVRSDPRRLSACLAMLASPVRPVSKFPSFVYHFLWACHVASTHDLSDAAVIHAPFAAGQGSMALFLATLVGKPLWITSHAYDLYCDRIALRRKLRHSDLFVTISEANAEWLRQRYGRDAEDVQVVRLGVDMGEYGFVPPSAREDGRTIVSVGSLNPKKGHATLIRACSRLRDQGVAFKCEIIGEGPARTGLETQIRDLRLDDHVVLLGSLPADRVRRRLAGATVAALACEQGLRGDRDGIPVALMEAMALGVPVVSTRISGIPELVQDGVSGRLVCPGDDDALARSLGDLLEDPDERERLAWAGRAVVEREFDQRANTEVLYGLVRRLVGKAGRAA